jgi:transposase InsO family protein
VRYEAQAPGELVHIDIKKLRGFRYAGRKFIEAGGRRWRGAPRQYLHVCVDSHSRYALARTLPRENARACVQFLEQVQTHFASLGIRVQRILTDNAQAYRGKEIAAATTRLGIRHSFTRVRRPQTNGKAEHFIRTAMTEWGYIRHETSAERDHALPAWLTYYNHHRSHSALGYKPPVSRPSCLQPVET